MGIRREPGSAPAAEEGRWTRYWRSGALHSCTCAFRGNYEGATARFWRAQCAYVPDGGVVVDIGTGNGAIPLLVKQALAELGRHAGIHGVDIAEIDPPASLQANDGRFDGIVFHPGVSVCRLPFADGKVDLVTGQYALEYADPASAVDEIMRVLAPGGRAAFVLHSRDSVLAGTTEEQIGSFGVLLGPDGLLAAAADMLRILAGARDAAARAALAADPHAQQSRRRLNEAAAVVTERIEAVAVPDVLRYALSEVSAVLRLASGGDAATAAVRLASVDDALRDECRRLEDLRRAALDEPGIRELTQRFVAHGRSRSRYGRLEHDDGKRLGWTLVVE